MAQSDITKGKGGLPVREASQPAPQSIDQGDSGSTPWSISATKQALTPSAPTYVTVAGSTGVALAANSSRTGLILTNTSGDKISIGFGHNAVLYSGVTLASGAIWQMDEYSFTTAAVNAISSGTSSNLGIQEFS